MDQFVYNKENEFHYNINMLFEKFVWFYCVHVYLVYIIYKVTQDGKTIDTTN